MPRDKRPNLPQLVILGSVLEERFRFAGGERNDMLILTVLAPGDDGDDLGGNAGPREISVKCYDDEGIPVVGMTYRFVGHWDEYHNKRYNRTEKQFFAKAVVPSEPFDRAGVLRYLRSAPGMNPTLANRAWKAFGVNAMEVCRSTPAVFAKALSVTLEEAAEIQEWMQENIAMEGAVIPLCTLLDGSGIPATAIRRMAVEFGRTAAEKIKAEPYLMLKIPGVGFARADALYLKWGHDPRSLKRQSVCGWDAIKNNQAGNTWSFWGVAESCIKSKVGGTEVQPVEAINLAIQEGRLAELRTDGPQGPPDYDGKTLWLADAREARNEQLLGSFIKEQATNGRTWLSVCEPWKIAELSSHQAAELGIAMQGSLAVLTGGPGTGKTHSIAAVIDRTVRVFPGQVAMVAPTGKAAVRLKEMVIRQGLDVRTSTIHSLLGCQFNKEGFSFIHNRAKRLELSAIFIDEASMLDSPLARSLFSALPDHCLVFLIGDIDQLPPVGSGAVLRDVIASGKAGVGRLTEIRRSEGKIVEVCRQIKDGKYVTLPNAIDEAKIKTGNKTGELEKWNIANLPSPSPQEQIKAIRDLILEAELDGLSGMWDVQVQCPLNERSEVSRVILNAAIQPYLNPMKNPNLQVGEINVGDKIINTVNGWFPLCKDRDCLDDAFCEPGLQESIAALDLQMPKIPKITPKAQGNKESLAYVPNGELGVALKANSHEIVVGIQSTGQIVSVRGKARADWELGYALSVHKMQGGEVPLAIVLADEASSARLVCDRAWWYTAISRAQQQCWILGSMATLNRDCKKNKGSERKTFLKEIITEEA